MAMFATINRRRTNSSYTDSPTVGTNRYEVPGFEPEIPCPECEENNYTDYLEPIDALKVIIIQLMFSKYLYRVSDAPVTSISIFKFWSKYPSRLQRSNKEVGSYLDNLFCDGLAIAKKMASNIDAQPDLYEYRTIVSLLDIPVLTNGNNYFDGLLFCGIDTSFVNLYAALFRSSYLKDICPDGILHEANIFYPELGINKGMNWNSEEGITVVPYVQLTAVQVGDININTLNDDSSVCWLEALDLSDRSVDEYIALVAQFSLDHYSYLMTDMDTYAGYPVLHNWYYTTCYNIIISSFAEGDYWQFCEHSDACSSQFKHFMNSVIRMVKSGRLRPTNDTELVKTLCTLMCHGERRDPDYILNSLSSATMSMVESFNASPYAALTGKHIIIGTEADDTEVTLEDNNDENTDNDPSGNDNAGGDDDDTDSFDDIDNKSDDTDNDTSDEENDTKKQSDEENAKPKLDPAMMLLELAKSNEKMTAYLYKETVARRIDSIINNPPDNVSPNDILMLKRWRTRWLFLVSTACLRDFISRIAIRLSDQ